MKLSRSLQNNVFKWLLGLELPAQVIKAANTPKKLLVFIMGGTPCDEKGNMGGSWDANCVSL
ncbi:MAG TPA: hypothetical protein VMW72_11850 [Sedimentisphaerales bacterium]|nr:hypothetical protein [Sedimentisphaerales bacterium]